MAKRPVIVLGAGSHARVILDALARLSVKVLGVTDAAPQRVDRSKLACLLLGPDENILRHDPGRVFLVNGVGSVGVDSKRQRLYERWKKRGYSFMSVVHPSAVLAPDVRLGEGTQVMAGTVIQVGCVVGDNTLINTRASVDHDCQIGSHVHVAPGVTLSGGVTVGEGAHLGVGAVVIQGVRIGKKVMIRAHSLVKKDVSR